jgi:hypothetical protein
MASPSSSLPARVTTVAADIVDAGGLAARAAEVASRQRSPQTRRTYAAVYRSLVAFLGEHAVVGDLTPETVRAYRDALEHADRTPATIAKHLSAIRGLAAAVGAEPTYGPCGRRASRAASRVPCRTRSSLAS